MKALNHRDLGASLPIIGLHSSCLSTYILDVLTLLWVGGCISLTIYPSLIADTTLSVCLGLSFEGVVHVFHLV